MGNEGNVKDNEEMEIDLLQLFEALKKKIWVILADDDHWWRTGRGIQQVCDYASVFLYCHDVHSL